MAELGPPTDLLALDPARIRQLQETRLASQVERLRARHPYYRRLFAELGHPRVASVADLDQLPPTTKADLVAAPADFRLEAADPPDPTDVVWDIAYTSGSTGSPTPLVHTARDVRGILAAQGAMAAIRGMTPADRIANLYPLTPQPHGAWLRAGQAAAVIGAELVVGLGGRDVGDYPVTRRTQEVLALVARSRPTVLWGVPSYLKHLLDEAIEAGVHIGSVRMLAVSGEPCPPAMVAALVQRCALVGAPDVQVSNSLGASELQCGLVECQPGSGFHNPAPDQFLIESLGADGRPAPDGEPGQLALTHLDRRGTALLRYLVGDVVAVTTQPCAFCGRAGGRVLTHHRREGTLVKVRGQLLDSDLLLRTVLAAPGVRDAQIVVQPVDPDDPLSMDELHVRVCLHGTDASTTGVGRLPVDLAAQIRATVGVQPRIEPVALADLFPTDAALKVRRFIDRRHHEEQR
jgi:phenylacetate-coenzyme A ligase PaaK-like adenylate-forming protein